MAAVRRSAGCDTRPRATVERTVKVTPPGAVARRARDAKQFLRMRHGAVIKRVPRRLFPSTWLSGPPDFVGVGVQRAGTTWWYAAIEAHPDVQRVPLAPKERHFFDAYEDRPFTDDDVAVYHRLFPRRADMRTGEWTPAYVYHPWTPPLLARAAPDARILVLLRDPVDRYASAISADERNRRRSEGRTREALARGAYHAQLSRLLEHVERERLLVLQYERCRASPVDEIRRTYAFLGLNQHYVPDVLSRRTNAAPTAHVDLPPDELEAVRAAYREDATALFSEFQELDPALWGRLGLV
jgi:hypothetical protein